MPKLPRNMVRKNGRYYYRKLINGKEVSRPLGASYRRAYLKLKEFERAEPAGPTATVKDLAELWCERYVATARRDLADRKKVGQRKRKYLLPFLGIKPLHLVTPDDLRAYRVWLEQQGIADQTVKHVLSEARCFFNWAVDSGYLAKSPVPKRLMPKIQERLPDRLTDAEVDELVQLPNPFGFAIRLGVGTGLRWGEMIRADAAHFRNGMLEVEHTKSGKVRRVPLTLPGLERELRTRSRAHDASRVRVPVARSRWLAGRLAGNPRARIDRDDASIRTALRGACPGGSRANSWKTREEFGNVVGDMIK
jgi:integrase